MVGIAAQAEVHDMRALQAQQSVLAPGTFGRQRVPAGAVLILQRAIAAGGGRWQGNRGDALLILAVVVQAGTQLPVKAALRVAFEGDAMHGVSLAVVRQAKRRGREVVGLAADIDGAAVDRLAVRPFEITL